MITQHQRFKIIFTEYLWLIIVSSFFLLRLPDFLANAFVPDEVFHVLHMKDIQNINYLAIDNFQGHGSAFWYFGALIERFFGEPITFYILRIFSLLSLVGTAFFIVLSFKSSVQKQPWTVPLFTIFVLTLPLFWWDGKLIFPEFFQCFLIAMAYYLIYIRKKGIVIAFFLLGFCLGLKLHAGAAIVFFVIDNFFESINKYKFKYFIRNFFVLVIGFLICNPIILTHEAVFFSNIRGNGHYFDISLTEIAHQWKLILTGRYPEWDLVYFGGMDKTSLPLVNFFLLLYMIGIACHEKKLRISSTIIFFSSIIVMLTINQRFLSHYLFTIVVLIILLASRLSDTKIKHLSVLFFLAIMLNMLTTVPDIFEEKALSREMQENFNHSHEHTQCILSTVQNKKFSLIIDNTDVGANEKREKFLLEEQLNLSNNIPLIHEPAGEELLSIIQPEILSAFIKGESYFLYLDGARTRKFSRYANFIPALLLSVYSHGGIAGKTELDIRFLADCYGTRVNLISVKNYE